MNGSLPSLLVWRHTVCRAYATLQFLVRKIVMPVILCLPSLALVFASAPALHEARAGGISVTTIESQTAPSASQATELKIGSSVERELQSWESHTYQISLKQGQYVNIVVQQLTLDIDLLLFDPAGRKINEVNLEHRGAPESLWAVAEESGVFQIKIFPRVIRDPNPRYSISLAKTGELRTAPASDQAYVRAFQLSWQAYELGLKRDEQSRRMEIEKYQETLQLWRSLKERVAEASTLMKLGTVYDRAFEREKAMACYWEALPIWRADTNHPGELADTLYNLGTDYSFVGESTKAIAHLTEALEIRRGLRDNSGQAFALTILGQIYYNLGDFQAALTTHTEALSLRQATGEIDGQARSLSNISAVYFSLGEFQKALDYCKQALPLRRAAHDRKGEAITLSNIATNYRELGEIQRALDYYQQALTVIGDQDRVSEAGFRDGIGRAYYELGDYLNALKYHQLSLSVWRSVDDRYGVAGALANIVGSPGTELEFAL